MPRVHLDMNNPEFQRTWFALESAEATRVFTTLRKISKLDWNQIYRDPGLKWEAIGSRTRLDGQRLYSFRATQKMRIVAYREGDTLRLQGVYPDHDSTYQ